MTEGSMNRTNEIVAAYEQAIAIVGRVMQEGGSRQEIYDGIVSDIRARISIEHDKAKHSRKRHADAESVVGVR